MSRETAGVVDEPARDGDEHAELLSELDSHALAFAMDMVEASDADVFGFDDAADPDDVFPQSVASGGPTPTARSPLPTASPRASSTSKT